MLQVEPNTKLFPAVFVQPSSQNVLAVELGKLKVRASHNVILSQEIFRSYSFQPSVFCIIFNQFCFVCCGPMLVISFIRIIPPSHSLACLSLPCPKLCFFVSLL